MTRTGTALVAGLRKLAGKFRVAQTAVMGRPSRVALKPLSLHSGDRRKAPSQSCGQLDVAGEFPPGVPSQKSPASRHRSPPALQLEDGPGGRKLILSVACEAAHAELNEAAASRGVA